MAGSGPCWGATADGEPSRERFGAPGWRDNVQRKDDFMAKHPDILITVPRVNGTSEFIASTVGGERILGDTSLGWLMDQLEDRFPGGGVG